MKFSLFSAIHIIFPKITWGEQENESRTMYLVAIIKKRQIIEQSLYTILQTLSVSIFEKVPIYQALTNTFYEKEITTYYKQLNLFDI